MNLRSTAVLTLLLASAAGRAAGLEHDVLLFGSAQLLETSGFDDPVSDAYRSVFESDQLVSADMLVSVQRESFRLFGEYLVTNHESDVERLQLGWQPSADTVLWLGRFHQASSLWNHEHHHGQYLQTSITRPAVEEWEDQQGIIPQHFTGLLVESSWNLARGGALRTAFGGGLAPFLTGNGLEPFDVTHPDARHHGFGFQARVGLFPDAITDTGFGLLFAHNELDWEQAPPPQFAGVSQFEQSIFGIFGNLEQEPWRLTGALYYLDTKPVRDTSTDRYQGFTTGYVEVERNLRQRLLVFARREDSWSFTRAAYLDLFPNFVTGRTILGLRWDFHARQALTLQIGDSRSRTDAYREFRLQWSGVLF